MTWSAFKVILNGITLAKICLSPGSSRSQFGSVVFFQVGEKADGQPHCLPGLTPGDLNSLEKKHVQKTGIMKRVHKFLSMLLWKYNLDHLLTGCSRL